MPAADAWLGRGLRRSRGSPTTRGLVGTFFGIAYTFDTHHDTFLSWGHVNPIGPRACYDEGKRVAETLTYGFQRQDGVDVRVARIFNTYGIFVVYMVQNIILKRHHSSRSSQ